MAEAETRLSPVLQTALDSIDRGIAGMSDEQIKWHPEGKWSAAEILEHLSLAYSRTAERMKPLVEQAQQPEVRRRTMKEWAGGLIVLKLGRVPAGRKSPEALCPRGLSPQAVRDSIRKNLAELDGRINVCEQRFGSSRKVMNHVILGPLSTREWRRFHCVHTLHHVKQIEALKEKMKQTASR